MEVQGEAILQFLTRWKEYSPVQQRKAAAILGALVADAAGRLSSCVIIYCCLLDLALPITLTVDSGRSVFAKLTRQVPDELILKCQLSVLSSCMQTSALWPFTCKVVSS